MTSSLESSQSAATRIQVIIDNSAINQISYQHQTTSTRSSLGKLAQILPRGPKIIWTAPKIIIRTAPKHHRTNRPLPTITEWSSPSPSATKTILAQRTISGGDIEYTLGTRCGDTVVEDPERCHLVDILDHVTEAELRVFDNKELKAWADAEEVVKQDEIAHFQRKRDRKNRLAGQLHKLGRPPGPKKLGRPKKKNSTLKALNSIDTSIDQASTLSSRTERRLQRNGTTMEEVFVTLPQVKKRIKKAHADISTGPSTSPSSGLRSVMEESANSSMVEVTETDEEDLHLLNDTRDSSPRDQMDSAPAKRFRMLSIASGSSNASQSSMSAQPSRTYARSPLLPATTKAKSDALDLLDNDDEEEDATQLLLQFKCPSHQVSNVSKMISSANEEPKAPLAAPMPIQANHVSISVASKPSSQVKQSKSPTRPAAGAKSKTPSRTSFTPLYPSHSASSIPRRRQSPFPSLSPPGKKAKKDSSTNRLRYTTPPPRESPKRASPLKSTFTNPLDRPASTTTADSSRRTRRSSTTPSNPFTALPTTNAEPATFTAPPSSHIPTATAGSTNTELDLYIDAVLDHRVVQQGSKRFIEYLIKWEGFPVEEAEWHGENVLLDAEDVIEAYRIRRVGVGGRLRA